MEHMTDKQLTDAALKADDVIAYATDRDRALQALKVELARQPNPRKTLVVKLTEQLTDPTDAWHYPELTDDRRIKNGTAVIRFAGSDIDLLETFNADAVELAARGERTPSGKVWRYSTNDDAYITSLCDAYIVAAHNAAGDTSAIRRLLGCAAMLNTVRATAAEARELPAPTPDDEADAIADDLAKELAHATA